MAVVKTFPYMAIKLLKEGCRFFMQSRYRKRTEFETFKEAIKAGREQLTMLKKIEIL